MLCFPAAVCVIMNMTVCLAGVPLELTLHYPDYGPEFAPFRTDRPPAAAVPETVQPDPYEEQMALSLRASESLLAFDRVIFHGVAFRWRERAWILTAFSGTGKTTQYMQWKRLYGDKVQIINGDKPVLEFRDRDILVHPSPWRGKERMGQPISAPLGGVILLEQGPENRITRLSPRQAAGRIFCQLQLTRDTAEPVRRAAALAERLLRSVPLWQLTNRGDLASAQLTHDTIGKEENRE